VQGHKWSVGIRDETGALRGVAIAGRPVSRMLDDGLTLEVRRVCTDGVPNGCSMLYGAMRRAGIALGYAPHAILTYVLASEPATSFTAAGWCWSHDVASGAWTRPARERASRVTEEEPKRCFIAGPPPHRILGVMP
jgi:hypothetical protein